MMLSIIIVYGPVHSQPLYMVDTCTLCYACGMVCYISHDWLNASKDPYNYCIQGTHNCNGSQWKWECKTYWHGYLLSSRLEVFINLMCRSKAVWVSSCVNLLHDQLSIDSIYSLAVASRRKKGNPYPSTTYTRELQWPSSRGMQPQCLTPPNPKALAKSLLDK